MGLRVKVDDEKRVLMKLASQDIPGASRILAVSLKRQESPNVILRKLEGAITGSFRPRGNWTDREYDIAYLVKALGGPRLSFVLQKAQSSPSVSSLRRHKPTPKLLVSIDTPTDEETAQNIETMLSNRLPPSHLAVGQVLMIDGIALEEVPRYDQDRDCVLGLCSEHSSAQSKQVDTLHILENLRDGLEKKRWHHAKEGILFTLAPVTDLTNYWPSPILAIPSCGAGTGSSMAKIIEDFVRVYNAAPSGRATHGDILLVATDGASSFRGARFELCLKQPVSTGLQELHLLKGLNTQTGVDDLLGCCDPKHIFKRFAQNLRSPSLRISFGDISIGYSDIRSALKHAGVSEERISMLLNPQDKQNVPIALDLIKELQSAQIPNTPEATRIRHVTLLAELYSFFITPFTDPSLSLSSQVRRLSTYAHLIFALYRKHGSSFMKGALYGDSVSIVKSIIILIARWKTKDGEIRFYIIHIGSDRLEGVFSHVRTQDHTRNCDILQLGNKSCIGAEINRILLKWPELDRGHEKRDIKDSTGEDHINAASWDKAADLRVGSVSLDKEFHSGQSDAGAWLQKNLGWAQVNWGDEFGTEADLLRPCGSYVGSNAANGASGEGDDEEDDSGAAILNDSTHPSVQPMSGPPTADDLEETPEEILGFEADTIEQPSIDTGTKYLVADGRRYHKSSIVPKYLISPSSRKVVIRQFRAAGMTLSDFSKGTRRDTGQNGPDASEETDAGAGSERVVTGDTVAFLCRCGNQKTVALAILEILHFRQGSASSGKIVWDIARDDLDNPNLLCVGQVIVVEFEDVTGGSDLWVWTKKYTSLSATERNLNVAVSASRVAVLRSEARTGSSPVDCTWVFEAKHLETIKEDLWALLEPDSDEIIANLDMLPKSSSPHLPYSRNSKPALVVDNSVALAIQKHDGDSIVPCHLCGSSHKIKSMRNHVGLHILRSIRGVADPSVKFIDTKVCDRYNCKDSSY